MDAVGTDVFLQMYKLWFRMLESPAGAPQECVHILYGLAGLLQVSKSQDDSMQLCDEFQMYVADWSDPWSSFAGMRH